MNDIGEPRPLWHSAAAAIAVLVMMYYAFILERRVPLLGWADLGFHELGHMITRPFGETFSFIMGSGTQVLIPTALGVYFWLTRRDPQAGFLFGWAASSFQDASVYIADAPHERLQLIGGDHDWAFLLNKWNMLDRADTISGMVWFIGLVLGFVGLALALSPFVRRGWSAIQAKRTRALAATLPVREPRPPRSQTD